MLGRKKVLGVKKAGDIVFWSEGQSVKIAQNGLKCVIFASWVEKSSGYEKSW